MKHVIEVQLYAPALWLTLGALIGLPWGWFAAWITDPSHIWMRVLGVLVMIDIQTRGTAKIIKQVQRELKQ